MPTIRTTEVQQHIGERVRLAGWLHQQRALGGIRFLLLRDGYGIVQAVTEEPERLAALTGLLPETVLALEGTVVEEAQARGGVELRDIAVEVITPVAEALPFPINKPVVKAQLNTFLDHATVGLRHPRQRAFMRLQAGIMGAYREFL